MLLVDSSVIVKFFSKEPGWEDTIKYISNSLTIPLALLELGSALSKKVGGEEIKIDIAMEMLDSYSKNAVFVEENAHLVSALKISISNKLAIYDSLFIAIAIDEGYDLVSCDRKQIDVARKLGVNTIAV